MVVQCSFTSFRSLSHLNDITMWVTGSSWEGYRWRDAGHRFELGGFLLDRCGTQVQVGRVFVG
jgi:hypothetical protein